MYYFITGKVKGITDQELVHSDPKSHPQTRDVKEQ